MSDVEIAQPPKESNARSLLKGLSWRILATTTTAIIAWVTIGDATIALKIGAAEFVIKFFVYYAHERAWQLVPLGTFPRVRGH